MSFRLGFNDYIKHKLWLLFSFISSAFMQVVGLDSVKAAILNLAGPR